MSSWLNSAGDCLLLRNYVCSMLEASTKTGHTLFQVKITISLFMHVKTLFNFKIETTVRCALLLISSSIVISCAHVEEQVPIPEEQPGVAQTTVQTSQCVGEVVAPPLFVPWLTEVDDPALVSASVKGQDKGGLCQAKAYRVNKPFEIFRAWNSNNPGSERGAWWSFNMPSGKISEYRQDFAICPKWSPLDMMTRCTIKEGAHLVLGTGQSAFCNQYLTYGASPDIQIFLQNAVESTLDCKKYDGIFSWQESQ